MSRGHFIGLNQHRLMLADRVRMEAYEAAIVAQVRPGMRVLDLGTGTGILAMWAARAGADVVAVEPHDIIAVARRLAEANGFAEDNQGPGGIEFVRADSRALSLDAPVDLVITECMGNFFVTDEMQPVLRDLPRHLAPGGKTLPRSISLTLGAATLPLWQELSFWEQPIGGLDFTEASAFAHQAAYVIACEPEFISVEATQVAQFPLVEAPDVLSLQAILPVTRAVTLHALVGWFDADLGEGITLTTAPGVRTHWGQMAFPLPATPVRVGDSVDVRLRLTMDDGLRCHYTWSGRIRRPRHPDGDVQFSRDTRQRFDTPAEQNEAY